MILARSLAQAGKRGGGGQNWRQKGDFMSRRSFASCLYIQENIALVFIHIFPVIDFYYNDNDPVVIDFIDHTVISNS
jgi:hypothetical protein